MGDLAWAQGVLAEMGATVVATLTHNTSLQELSQVAAAEACLVLSHDAGQRAAEQINKGFQSADAFPDVQISQQ